MHTIPRDRIADGEIGVFRRKDMIIVTSDDPRRQGVLGMSIKEARQVALALLKETAQPQSAESREGLRHALMSRDLPRELDDGIVDYD